MDSLTFRAPKFLRHLIGSYLQKDPCHDVAKVAKHGSIETILESINKERKLQRVTLKEQQVRKPREVVGGRRRSKSQSKMLSG
ncbi:hypothetical protein N665_0326s0003 [Sinapis alba]|nr:hypothetical protein N665_0326s0003 [Sinapis alba]